MMEPIIFEDALEAWVNNPNGAIARELETIAQQIVVADAHEALSIQADGSLNPAPGPPRFRTGDLFASVRSVPAMNDNDQLVVFVVADPVHSGQAYAIWLRDHNYRFLPPRDYYQYEEVSA